jgi:D-proline reductase (dithiol) PrdB
VCHQTVSLVARHLEAQGIPTVVYGCARDIVEAAAVPRFVFTDFPLGNPCGRPFDAEMQRRILESGLRLLETATAPTPTVTTPYVWSDDDRWKRLIFTKEQPFLEGEAYEHWMSAKEKYRQMKSEGKV